MKDIIYTFDVSTHFVSAIINGDESGLTDEDCAQLRAFEQNLPRHYHYKTKKIGIWDVIDHGNDFAMCEVCDLHADCATLTLTFI
jgi:hypothetical protein